MQGQEEEDDEELWMNKREKLTPKQEVEKERRKETNDIPERPV